MTIKEVLKSSRDNLIKNSIDEPMLKARLLLAFVLDKPKEYLVINDNEEISQEALKCYTKTIDRIINGEPLQYIIGKQEFMGLEFMVNSNVLIPQPDTEILVEEVIELCRNKNNPKILDLCTGSGAIGISIAKILKCKMTLSDISEDALDVARFNVNKNNVNVKIIKSDLFKNINEKFDIIVSNPPYIETDVIKTLSKEVQNEPHLALNGGLDGLEFYKKIINEAIKYLNNDGILALEIGNDQKEAVMDLIKENSNYIGTYSKKDLAGNDRIIVTGLSKRH